MNQDTVGRGYGATPPELLVTGLGIVGPLLRARYNKIAKVIQITSPTTKLIC